MVLVALKARNSKSFGSVRT